MTSIKLTQSTMIAGKVAKVGSVVDVDDGLARNLILRGRASKAEAAKEETPTNTKPKK